MTSSSTTNVEQSDSSAGLDASSYVINGRRIKLKNRRVWLGQTQDGHYAVMTKCLIPAEKRADRVQVTKNRWTKEGLSALCYLFLEQTEGRI